MQPQFVNEGIYHLYNRGVDKRDIFMDKVDYYRFIHDLFEFNDIKDAPSSNMRFHSRKPSDFRNGSRCLEVLSPNISKEERRSRELLVEIMAWCLMPNHFHLFVRQLKENGISHFLRKIGVGYTIYFNQKYERSGALFQGTFQAIHVNDEAYFAHLPFYIHCNPLDLIEPGWRYGKIKNYKKAIEFLERYKYSGHLDYIGKKNFASVSQREWLLGVLGGSSEYKKQCYEWLKGMDSSVFENQEFSTLVLDR